MSLKLLLGLLTTSVYLIFKRPRMSSHLSMEAILLSRSANDFE